MARIPQCELFSWEFVGTLPDLERIKLVLENLEDEELVSKLEGKRGVGRDDYPVRPMWNFVVSFLLTGHVSWAAHLRELHRNRDLASLCGFSSLKKLPRPHNLSRFLSQLLEMKIELVLMFHSLINTVGTLLPDFGRQLAVDSKAIRSFAVARSEEVRKDGQPDGRGEHDAAIGKKTQFVEKADGTVEEQLYEWFGFKLHLMVDTQYQLPVAFKVTQGLEADTSHLEPLLRDWQEQHPDVSPRTEEISADKAYDDKDNHLAARAMNAQLLSPTRKMWREGDGKVTNPAGEKILLKLLPKTDVGNLAYDQDGQIYCAFDEAPDQPWSWRPLVFKGYEADREAVKYICPAKANACTCPCAQDCSKGLQTTVRVKLSTDPRIFTSTPRHTLKFERLYNRRTAIERVNGILDNVLGLEWHTMRGKARVELRVTLSLCAMLAMAIGRLRKGQHQLLGSLVRAA